MLEPLAALLALAGAGGYALTLAVSAAMRIARDTTMRWRPAWWSLIALGTAIAAIGFDAVFSPAVAPGRPMLGHGSDWAIGLLGLGIVVAIVGGWRGAVARWQLFGEFDWKAPGTGAPAPTAVSGKPTPFRGTGWPGWTPPVSAAPASAAAHSGIATTPPAPALSPEARAELERITSPAMRSRLEALMAGRNRPDRAVRMAIAKTNARAGVTCLVVAIAILTAVPLLELPSQHPFRLYAAPAAFFCCVGAVVAFARAAWYAMRI